MHTSSKPTTVCERCNGEEMEEVTENINTNTNPTYFYRQPESAYYVDTNYVMPYPKPESGGKVQGIISMILGIEAIVSAFASILYPFVFKDLMSVMSDIPFGSSVLTGDMTTSAMSTAISAIVSAIVSICLASVAKKRGNASKMPAIGKVLSFVSLGLGTVGFILGFLTSFGQMM